MGASAQEDARTVVTEAKDERVKVLEWPFNIHNIRMPLKQRTHVYGGLEVLPLHEALVR
jgi:hypothetical protein